ncbi:MAG: hypothetical protein ABWY11_09330 [Umezawaea sp.]
MGEDAGHGNALGGSADVSFQARDVHGDVSVTGRSWSPRAKWTAAAAVLLLAAAAVTAVVLSRRGPELVTTQRVDTKCTTRHVDGDPEEVDVERVWQSNADALTTGMKLRITVQNPSPDELLLMGVGIEVVRRTPPPAGGFFMPVDVGCGDPVLPRAFEVDLNHSPPSVLARPSEPGTQGEVVPAVDFPFQIGQGDPEVLDLRFTDVADLVEFAVVLDVVVDGDRTTVRLDHGGRPYRLTGTGGRPRFSVVGRGTPNTYSLELADSE